MKGKPLSCTIFPFCISDFYTFSLGVAIISLMTTMPLGNHYPRPFPTGSTNLGGSLYNHHALHVFMRTHSLMIYTPIGHDYFQGAGQGQRNGSFVTLFMGTREYHGIWKTYRLDSLDGSLILLILSTFLFPLLFLFFFFFFFCF